MARHEEKECAFCAEEIKPEKAVLGQDWKVYCCTACAQQGEALSLSEMRWLMRHISDRHWPAATV